MPKAILHFRTKKSRQPNDCLPEKYYVLLVYLKELIIPARYFWIVVDALI